MLSEFDLLDLLILILATFRLSVLAANDDEAGPGNILSKLRHLAGVRYTHGVAGGEPGSFADGLMCYYCNSLWFGLINTVAYVGLLAVGWPAKLIFLPLALSGFVVLVYEYKS